MGFSFVLKGSIRESLRIVSFGTGPFAGTTQAAVCANIAVFPEAR
jgi:hypothetical protein